jgi:hypothetical protein
MLKKTLLPLLAIGACCILSGSLKAAMTAEQHAQLQKFRVTSSTCAQATVECAYNPDGSVSMEASSTTECPVTLEEMERKLSKNMWLRCN